MLLRVAQKAGKTLWVLVLLLTSRDQENKIRVQNNLVVNRR